MFEKELDPTLRGIVSNLNDISPALLNELRAVSELEAHRLLMHYVAPSIRDYARAFLREVVADGKDPRMWRRGGVLVPDWSVPDLLTRPISELLAPLDAARGQLFLVRPSRAGWEQGAHSLGAPAVRRPDLDYTWKAGPHVVRMPIDETSDDAVEDRELAMRRWIASRLAMMVDDNRQLFTARDPEEWLHSAGVAPSSVTNTGLAAAEGLFRERPLLEADASLIPGFAGPAEFYTNYDRQA